MPVSRRAPQILLAGCLGAAALAGCGSGSTPTTTTTTSTAPPSNGVAAMRPPDMLAAAAAALRGVSSYRLQGTMTESSSAKTRTRMSISVYPGNAVWMVLADDRGVAQVIIDGRKAYLRANHKFWAGGAHISAQLAALFANRWLVVSAAEGRSLSSTAGHFAPRYLANCLAQPVGGLAKGATTTVGGQQGIVLRERGNAPGGQPMSLAIATAGPAYPLRLTATGKQRPGGPKGPCYSSGPSSTGTITISDFGQLGALRVPHAVTPQTLELNALRHPGKPA
jgi:hypothetical protein